MTLEGSLSLDDITLQLVRLPHSSICSIAPALNVSPATNNTFFPSLVNLYANFPIVVVFPTPFTPTKRITVGPSSAFYLQLHHY